MSAGGFQAFARLIEGAGLSVRGGFHATVDDGVPPDYLDAQGGGTLVLIGNAGRGFWSAFTDSAEYRDGLADPLNRWSERVITELGRRLEARPAFPFKGPPYYPFLRWARRAEPVSPSPLGMLIHPEYGLWHAYRGALITPRRLAGLPQPEQAASPCLSCPEQPCLNGCPVAAFGPDGFDVDACASHLSGPNACLDGGCQARNACPAGKPFRYVREQHRFHLAAFHRARQRERG